MGMVYDSCVEMAFGAPLCVGLASLNRAKQAAVRQVFRRAGVPYTLIASGVPSGVSAQPTSDAETVRGALNRVHGLIAAHASIDLAIAFEGGIQRELFGTFLCEWCAVADRRGATTLGSGPRIPLPPQVVRDLEGGLELGEIFDKLVGRRGVGATEGAYGILTRNVLTRADADGEALIAALAKYLQPEFYESIDLSPKIIEALTEAFEKRPHGSRRAGRESAAQLELLPS
jgi:inosine/xanthosine triphosphatase